MVNSEQKLKVDDLIVEYMVYKVRNGYEPSFLTSEFISFLYFFESKMPVDDSLYENDKLFHRFFECKAESDWSRTVNRSVNKKEIVPHMEFVYSEKDNDYLIKANYKLSDYDVSIINTYFMPGGQYDQGKTKEIRNIISEYLSTQPKREIDENSKVDDNDLIVGKYIAAEIIANIWESHIKILIDNKEWPRQCNDINKYLLKQDLAKIIGIKSMKSELIELYNVLSKRIAILYQQDKNLRISTYSNPYLAKANYELLIQGYEKIMGVTFGKYKKTLDVDLAPLTFKEGHEIHNVHNCDEDSDIETTTVSIGNENIKKLVKCLDNQN